MKRFFAVTKMHDADYEFYSCEVIGFFENEAKALTLAERCAKEEENNYDCEPAVYFESDGTKGYRINLGCSEEISICVKAKDCFTDSDV